MPIGSSSLISPSLERFLEAATDREQIIAGNMANVDTPGYHTRDLSFKQALSISSDGQAQFTPVVHQVSGLMERPDGNNVDLDREGMMLAKTQLQYQMGTQLIKSSFHQLLSAINGGGN